MVREKEIWLTEVATIKSFRIKNPSGGPLILEVVLFKLRSYQTDRQLLNKLKERIIKTAAVTIV